MKTQTLHEYSAETAKELIGILAKMHADKKEVKGEGTFEVVASTESLDRDGEKILVKGWDLTNYMKNPVILFGHDYWSLPVGAVTEAKIENGQLIAKGVFARTAAGQEIRQLYDDGILKTVSVGFIPKTREGNVITSAELLEISFVPVPSNPDALSLSKVAKVQTMLKTESETKIWDETDAEFRYRVKDPALFEADSFRTVEIKKDKPRISAIMGKLKGETVMTIQALRFPKDDGWTLEDAKKWVEDHKADLEKTYNEKDFLSKGQIEMLASMREDLVALVDAYIADIQAEGEPDNGKGAKPEVKGGRTLSAKTRNTISNAIKASKVATKALQDLLDTADAQLDGADPEKSVIQILQAMDKTLELAIIKAKGKF